MQEMILFLYRATKCPTKAELINFGGLNETDEYNRIFFLLLLRLTFEKTTDDNTLKIKAKNSCKNQSENK